MGPEAEGCVGMAARDGAAESARERPPSGRRTPEPDDAGVSRICCLVIVAGFTANILVYLFHDCGALLRGTVLIVAMFLALYLAGEFLHDQTCRLRLSLCLRRWCSTHMHAEGECGPAGPAPSSPSGKTDLARRRHGLRHLSGRGIGRMLVERLLGEVLFAGSFDIAEAEVESSLGAALNEAPPKEAADLRAADLRAVEKERALRSPSGKAREKRPDFVRQGSLTSEASTALPADLDEWPTSPCWEV